MKIENDILLKAQQMGVNAIKLMKHMADSGTFENYRCAFNNPNSPSNIKDAKIERGMSKINNLLARFKH